MSFKFTPAVILYIVALILFLFSALGGSAGQGGIAYLGLASLTAGFIVDKWER